MADNYGDNIRSDIDTVDAQIRDLIAERCDLTVALHIWKNENDFPLYDAEREATVIKSYVEDFGKEDGEAIARAIMGKENEG